MDKYTWFDMPKAERASHMKLLLHELVKIDKLMDARARTKDKSPLHTNRFKLEQQILEIIEWENEEHDEDTI